MRFVLPLAASVVVCLAVSPAVGDDKRDCASHKSLEQRLAACSKVIGAAPGDAAAYRHRGDAHAGTGEIDKAIADFDKAIQINPRLAAAYDGRGRAYVRKGDYTRAVADVTRANELAPKAEKAPAPEKASTKPAGKVAEPAPRKPAQGVAKPQPMAKVAAQEAWPAWALRTTD